MAIRIDKLRQADLNLLIYFVALVEERSVSGAALRLHLTQPALSRALQRLRELFNDELLVRGEKGYKITKRGEELLAQLALVLPQLDSLISGTSFDAAQDEAVFNIVAADSLCHLYCPILAARQSLMPDVRFSFSSYSEERFSRLETNCQDLVMDADFKTLDPKLRKETLFEEEFVCAIAKDSRHKRQSSLHEYLALNHVAIDVLHSTQAIPDMALTRLGHRRRCVFLVPYFEVALRMVSGSQLVATLPRNLAVALIDNRTTRLVEPPKELSPFRYVMVWHRRHDRDPRHSWLRQAFRDATKDLLKNIGKAS